MTERRGNPRHTHRETHGARVTPSFMPKKPKASIGSDRNIMTNMEKSELVIAKILGLLMEWGLSSAQLEFDELDLDPTYQDFFVTCVEWLESECIIRTQEVTKFLDGKAIVFGPTLTAHGFSLMGRKLMVANVPSTIGEAVQKTAKETSFYTGFGDFGGGFVGGLLKSLGNG